MFYYRPNYLICFILKLKNQGLPWYDLGKSQEISSHYRNWEGSYFCKSEKRKLACARTVRFSGDLLQVELPTTSSIG